jgi:hypothetical protein
MSLFCYTLDGRSLTCSIDIREGNCRVFDATWTIASKVYAAAGDGINGGTSFAVELCVTTSGGVGVRLKIVSPVGEHSGKAAGKKGQKVVTRCVVPLHGQTDADAAATWAKYDLEANADAGEGEDEPHNAKYSKGLCDLISDLKGAIEEYAPLVNGDGAALDEA